MKTTNTLILSLFWSITQVAVIGHAETLDKSEAPYFYIPGIDKGTETMPLKSMVAKGSIAGVIADMSIEQVFENTGDKPIEAIYVFPGSTKAAVYALEMRIGERVVKAKIDGKDQARATYEAAKEAGKTASLLEQHRPNVFQMNVANVMPGDIIKVQLKYTELLVPSERIYELSIPTVVGPRYSGENGKKVAATSWNNNPFLKHGEKTPYKFSAEISLLSPIPIQSLRSPSHTPKIDYKSKNHASIKLEPGDGGNRDFVISYKLAGDKVNTGTLLYEGEDENFFLTMIQPPDRVQTADLVDREYIFVVDVSGSMHGFPLETSKALMKDLLGNLNEGDYFNILLFAGSNQVLSPESLPATRGNIEKGISFIENQRGGGGTALMPALRTALAMKRSPAESRSFVIATDGFVTVEDEAFELIRTKLDQANFFSFGIGSSVNRHLIEGIARAGVGEPFVILNANEAPHEATKFRKYIDRPLLAGINVDFDGFQAFAIEPMHQPDVFADRPLIMFGKYSGIPKGKIKINGKAVDGEFSSIHNLQASKPDKNNSALRYLWARNRIADLAFKESVGSTDAKDEITRLGLEYSLLTKYTSFVAVDSEIRNNTGGSTTVRQPLPLPEGVSNYALGAASGGRGGAYSLQQAPMGVGGPPSYKSRAMPAKPDFNEESRRNRAAESEPKSMVDQGRSDDRDELLAVKKTSVIQSIKTKGGLSDEAVRQRIVLHNEEIKQCLAGPVTNIKTIQVTFQITKAGQATKITFLNSKDSTTHSTLEKCVRKRLSGIDFTRSKNPTRVELSLVW